MVLNAGLGGIRDVASVIISHKQIHSNRFCYFQTLDAEFPKDRISDYLVVPDMVLQRRRNCGFNFVLSIESPL